MSKKKFKDTKIAEFLKNKAPGILNVVGDVLPNNGAFGIIKNLSKNTRPMSLIFLTLMTTALIWVDSIEYVSFSVNVGWVNLLQTLTTTVYVAYFGSRGAEKWKTLSNNK